MRSHTNTVRRLLIVAACLVVPGIARAAFLGASATIDQLTPGMTIGVNGFTFGDFALIPSASINHQPIPPSSFSVTAVPLPNNKVQLAFQFPGVWTQGQFSEFILKFTALAPTGQAFMQHDLMFGPSLLGDLSGGAYATIAETVMPSDPNSTQGPYTLGVYKDSTFQQLFDTKQIVTPANKLVISKDIQVYGGSSTGQTRVILTDFSQTFMTAPPVPEPATVGLAILGMAVVAATRRRLA